MKYYVLSAVVAVMLLSDTVSAANVTTYRVDAFIKDSKRVVNVVTFEFDSEISGFEYTLNTVLSSLNARSNANTTECSFQTSEEKTKISCAFGDGGATILKLVFDSVPVIKKIDDAYQFWADYTLPVPVGKKVVSIRLPEGGVLANAEEGMANISYFPRNGEVFTDGRRIGITWKSETPEEPLQFLILYSVNPETTNIEFLFSVLVSAVMIIVFTAVVLILYVKRAAVAGKTKAIRTVLNQDEKRIVDVLVNSGGKAYQKAIVRETDFSKAKVSRLVKGLKERGIVEIEPVSGRENMILLRIEMEK